MKKFICACNAQNDSAQLWSVRFMCMGSTGLVTNVPNVKSNLTHLYRSVTTNENVGAML